MATLIGKQDLINWSFKDQSFGSIWLLFNPTLACLVWLSVEWHYKADTESWDSKCWSLSRVQLFAAPWTVAHQAPLSMEEWVAIAFNPNPGIEPWSPALQADSLPSEPQGYTLSIKKLNFCWYESYKFTYQLYTELTLSVANRVIWIVLFITTFQFLVSHKMTKRQQ